jgi:hypothetical protein
VRLSVTLRAMIRPPDTDSLKVRLSVAVRVAACAARVGVSENVRLSEVVRARVEAARVGVSENDSDSVTVLLGACAARGAVSLKVSDSVTVRVNDCAARSALSAKVSVSLTVAVATVDVAATSGVGPFSQNGQRGFGFSRPVVGPKLGMA